MLTEEMKEKTRDHAFAFSKEDMRTLLGIPISPGREQCAFLGVRTLHDGLTKHYE